MNEYFNDYHYIKSIFNYRRAMMFSSYHNKSGLLTKTKNFSGIVTIGRLRIKDIVSVSIDLSDVTGHVKLVAVSKEDIIVIFDSTRDLKKSMTMHQANYRLRVIGDNASFELLIGTNV